MALAVLALVVFGAYDSYPVVTITNKALFCDKIRNLNFVLKKAPPNGTVLMGITRLNWNQMRAFPPKK